MCHLAERVTDRIASQYILFPRHDGMHLATAAAPPACFSSPATDLGTMAQSSEARLYTFSQETKDQLRKFRLGTSRANEPQAVICTSCHCSSDALLTRSASSVPQT